VGEGVLCVLSSLEVHKKPPDTSQQVLVTVKSEDPPLFSYFSTKSTCQILLT